MAEGRYEVSFTAEYDPVALRAAVEKARVAGLMATAKPVPRPWWHLTPFWSGYFVGGFVFTAISAIARWWLS